MITVLPARALARIATLFVAAALCTARSSVAEPRPVEFWHVGDDGLSQRLADEVESAFKQSHIFRLSTGLRPGTLVVKIPTNVTWKMMGKQKEVFYTVEFSTVANQKISSDEGSCSEDDLSDRASRILKHARAAAEKIH